MEQTRHVFLVDDHNPDNIQVMMFELNNNNPDEEKERLSEAVDVLAYLQERATFKLKRPGKAASVLVDVKVPKNAGREILKQLLQSKKLHSVPIILVTSDESTQTLDHEALGDRIVVLNTEELKQYHDAIAQLGVSWVESDRPN